MTDGRGYAGLPNHVIVMLAASTAGYALLLAGVAGLQAHSEADLAAGRAPAVDGVAAISSGHDALATRLDAARAEYTRTVSTFLAAGGSLDQLQEQLGAFSALVEEIDGVSRAMPTTVKLPPVRSSVSSVRIPKTHSTTGASGG